MEGLKSRLSQKKAPNTRSATQADNVTESTSRPVREAHEKAKQKKVWLEAQHKRPTNNHRAAPKTTKAPTKSKNSNTRARKGVSKHKKAPAMRLVVHEQSDDGDENEEEDEEVSEGEDKSEESDDEDDAEGALLRRHTAFDQDTLINDSFATDNDGLEDEVFVVPRSHSRASSISLPPAQELFEDDEDESFAGQKRKSPPVERSDVEDEDDEPEPKKTRHEKFLSERPQITGSVTSASKTTSGKLKKTATPVETKPVIWSDITKYTPLASGARILSKGKQPAHFQSLLEKASVNAIALFLFDTAYPDPKKKALMLTEALTLAASDLQQADILKRLQHPAEQKYKKFLEDYIFNRVVHARGEVRKSVTSIILSAYPLTGADNVDVTAYLSFIRKKCRYIYPQNIAAASTVKPTVPEPSNPSPVSQPNPLSQEQPGSERVDTVLSQPAESASPPAVAKAPLPVIPNLAQVSRASSKIDEKTLKKSQPYKHNAITSVLKTLFAGDTSPGIVYQDLFISTLPNSDEKEIPKAMLAMVASVVHFCLGEWASGSHVSHSFKANTLRSEYNKHSEFLDKIATNPQKYHRLMADLYRIASGDDIDGDTSDDGVPDIDLDELAG